MVTPALRDACKQFEAMLLRSLWPHGLSAPAASSLSDETVSGYETAGNELVDGLLGEAFARALAEAGGIGLASRLAAMLSSRPS